MLKSNKFLLGLVTALGISSTGFNASAEIVDTFESTSDNKFYLLETLPGDNGTTNTVYEYDMALGGTSVSALFQISETPTQIAKLGSTLYISAGRSLWAYTTAGTRTHIRNLITDAIDLIATQNHLIVLQGAPDNGIFVYRRQTGSGFEIGDQIARTPFPATPDEFFEISAIHYDSAGSRLIVQIASGADNPEGTGSQYMMASFDDNDNVTPLGALTTIPVNDGGASLANPDGMSRAFFLDDLQMAIDDSGRAVDFEGADIIFSHSNPEEALGLSGDLIATHQVETDATVDYASDDSNYAYYAMTLDNICNPIGVGGSRIIRRNKENRVLKLPSNGFMENDIYYYDTANSIHSIVSDGTNQFLFYGEGSELAVETIDNTDYSYPFLPWTNENYSPNNANMSKVRQSTSFALDTTNIAIQIEDGCDHYVAFWSTTTNSFYGHTETRWFDAIDGAYVPGLNRIFIAFSDGDNYFVQHLDSDTPESQDDTKFSLRDLRTEGTIHKLVSAGNFLVVSMTDAQGTDRLVSYTLQDLVSGSVTVRLMDQVSTITDTDITDCCAAWTGAVYSDSQKRIYYTTAEGLYYITFDQAGDGTFSGSVTRSRDYGAVHTIPSDNPFLSLNSDASLLFLDSQVYSTASFDVLDSIGGLVSDVAFFTADAAYSIDINSATFETSTYSSGSSSLLDAPNSTPLTGSVVALLPITSGGNVVPLTLATENGTLNIAINGALAANVGDSSGTDDGSGGDDSDSDTGGNDGGCSVTNQCVQAPGGGGGGPVDILLLLGLAGLGVRQLRKQL